jgi:hypothetical protein
LPGVLGSFGKHQKPFLLSRKVLIEPSACGMRTEAPAPTFAGAADSAFLIISASSARANCAGARQIANAPAVSIINFFMNVLPRLFGHKARSALWMISG